jgi:hypothetical protein
VGGALTFFSNVATASFGTVAADAQQLPLEVFIQYEQHYFMFICLCGVVERQTKWAR